MISYFLFSYIISFAFSIECHPSCKECMQNTQKPTSEQCTACFDGFYKHITWDTGENLYGECLPCPKGCKLCTSEDICTDCNPGYTLDQSANKCESCHESCLTCTGTGEDQCSECAEGYFTKNVNNILSCIKCTDNCKVCESESTCKECKEKFYRTNDGQCEGCDISCKSCEQTPTNCIECDTGFYRHEDQCLKCNSNCHTCDVTSTNCTSCDEGQYLDKETRTCNRCYSDECKECTGPLQCTTCYDGYTPDPNGQKCEKCPEDCATCKYIRGGSEIQCTECATSYTSWYTSEEEGYVLCTRCLEGCYKCNDQSTCETCQPGYYKFSEKACYECSSSCLTCSGNAENCTSCHEGYYSRNGKCSPCTVSNCHICASGTSCKQCNNGYFLSGSTCTECPSNCKKCDNKDTCITCNTGFFNNNGNCQTCQSNCEVCNATHCLDCAPEHYPLEDASCSPCATVCSECTGPTDKDCIECDPGWYFSRLNRNCFKCNEACSLCTGPNANECTECAKGYYMNNGKCTKCENGCESCKDYRECTKCQAGFHLVDNNGDKDCEPCSMSGCMDCEDDIDVCKKCFPGYFESQSTSSALTCRLCSENCQTCDGKQPSHPVCNECFSGYYPDDQNNCIKCDLPCSSCKSKTECTSCADGYLFEGGSCNTPCSPECLSCEKKADNCLSCHNGFVLSGSTCIACPSGCKTCEIQGSASICLTCLDGYQKDNGKCDRCHESCATCYSESHLACYSCAVGYFKYSISISPDVYAGECHKCEEGLEHCSECSSECIDDNLDNNQPCGGFKCTKCGPGFYLVDQKCQPCNSTCYTCFGPEPFHCDSCHDKFFLENNYCVGCDSSCNTCYGESTNCTSCNSNSYLDNNKCIPCKGNCDECTNETFCTKCSSSFYLFDGKCHQKCSDLGEGFIGNDETFECQCGPNYVLNGTVCKLLPTGCDDHHCNVEDNAEGTEYTNYTFPLSEVNEYYHEESGGAVRAINVQFTAINTTFNGCYSVKGGAGGVFIYNKIDSIESKGSIYFKNVTFSYCKAFFGAAVYIYHISQESEILLESCKFISNELYTKSSNNKIYGGSALYINAKSAQIIDTIFKSNKGKGGACKLVENVDEKPDELSVRNSKSLRNNNNTRGSFLISGCQFEIDESSDCSLFYGNKKHDLSVEVKDCVFTGNLKKGAHYIDGQSENSQSPKIYIKSCSFSSDEKGALNKKFANIDLNDKKYSDNKFEKKESSRILMAASTLAVAAVVVVAITINIVKKRKSNDNEDENNEKHDTQNSTLI